MELPILLSNDAVLSAVAMTADRFSTQIDAGEIKSFSVHSVWTGTPVGNIIIEAGNDGSSYVALNTQAAGGAAGSALFSVSDCTYRYLRVRYTFTSSTGTLTSTLCAKR